MKHEERARLTADVVAFYREINFTDPEAIQDLLEKWVEVVISEPEIKILMEGNYVPRPAVLRALTELLRRLALDKMDDGRGERLTTAFPESPRRWAERADALAVEALRRARDISLGSNPIFEVQQLQAAAGNDGDLLFDAANCRWLTSGPEEFNARAMSELAIARPPAAGTREQVRTLLREAAGPLTGRRTVRRSNTLR